MAKKGNEVVQRTLLTRILGAVLPALSLLSPKGDEGGCYRERHGALQGEAQALPPAFPHAFRHRLAFAVVESNRWGPHWIQVFKGGWQLSCHSSTLRGTESRNPHARSLRMCSGKTRVLSL